MCDSPIRYALCFYSGGGGTTFEVSDSIILVIILSPHRARQLYRIESLHPTGHPVTAAVLRTAMKETY
jgi:hypothetical protein